MSNIPQQILVARGLATERCPGFEYAKFTQELDMATQAEHAQALRDLTQQYKTLATRQDEVATQVVKIGGETDMLIIKIEELKIQIGNSGDVTPEVQSALDDLLAQTEVVRTSSAALAAAVTAVDTKVEDAAP